MQKPTAPGSCCQVDTSSAAQEGPVLQGFADGNIAVIGHDGEKRILCTKQEKYKENLGSTTPVGIVPGVPERIDHRFGDSGRDGAKVEEGEVEEEEVHGGVEVVVTGYGSDDEAIAHEGSQVDGQEEPEVQELQLPRVCECQEEELCDGAAVGHLLSLGTRTVKGGKGIIKLGQISQRRILSISHRYHQKTSPLSGRLLAGLFHVLWLVLAEDVTGAGGSAGGSAGFSQESIHAATLRNTGSAQSKSTCDTEELFSVPALNSPKCRAELRGFCFVSSSSTCPNTPEEWF